MASRESPRIKSTAELKQNKVVLAKVVEDVFPQLLKMAKKDKRFRATLRLSYEVSSYLDSIDEEVFMVECMQERFRKESEAVTVSISMPEKTLLGVKFRAMIHVSRKK